MSRQENRRVFDTIKKRAPFRLGDIAAMANIKRNTFNEWSAGRRTPPDDAFPAIADALRKKAQALNELADELDAARSS